MKLYRYNLRAGEAAWLTTRSLRQYTEREEIPPIPEIFVLNFKDTTATIEPYSDQRYKWFAAPEFYIRGQSEEEVVREAESFASLFSTKTEHVIFFQRGYPIHYPNFPKIPWHLLIAYAGFNESRAT